MDTPASSRSGAPEPLDADPDRPVALVLSGGGARGTFQVGAWKVLSEDPRGFSKAPFVVSGTSAGALNGALIAAGLSPEQMLDFWLGLADDPPVRANDRFFAALEKAIRKILWREPLRGFGRRAREARILARLFSKHSFTSASGIFAMVLEFLLTARFDNISTVLDEIDTPYLFDTRPILDRLHKTIGARSIDSKVRLAINTVDVRSGKVVRIVNWMPEKAPGSSAKHYRYEPHISLEMILASASIPLLFSPVDVGDKTLWDGGLLVNSPMAPAVALGATRIVPVLVTTSGAGAPFELTTFGAAVERLVDAFLENAYNIDRKLMLDRNVIAERDPNLRKVELFRALRPDSSRLFNAGSYLYFERQNLLAMYEAGQEAARRWLSRGPEVDNRSIED